MTTFRASITFELPDELGHDAATFAAHLAASLDAAIQTPLSAKVAAISVNEIKDEW